jgi:hypothetical protein
MFELWPHWTFTSDKDLLRLPDNLSAQEITQSHSSQQEIAVFIILVLDVHTAKTCHSCLLAKDKVVGPASYQT